KHDLAAGARRLLFELLEASDDLERIRLAVDDVAELDEGRLARCPVATGIDEACAVRDVEPCLIVAVKVADGDDALRLSGCGGRDDEQQGRERDQRAADHPLEREPCTDCPHRAQFRTTRRRGQCRLTSAYFASSAGVKS